MCGFFCNVACGVGNRSAVTIFAHGVPPTING